MTPALAPKATNMVSASKLDEIESKLGENVWLGGQQPSKDDLEAFNGLDGVPSAATHPGATAWYCLVAKFTEAVRGTWSASSG